MVSVCLGTYNGEKYIYKQIKSILNEIDIEDEIIVSDNMSSDSTIEIINLFKDPRIKIFYCKTKGVVSNFENAIKKANGDYIFLSDQDDIWKDGKYIAFMKAFKNGHEIILSNCSIIDENDIVIRKKFIESPKLFFLNILIQNPYIGCCMAFSKNIRNIALPFPEKIPMHDWWIGLIGSFLFKPFFLNNDYTLYRLHDNFSETISKKSPFTLIKKISFRINLFLNLLNNILKYFLKNFLKKHNK
jgi:glycosyltransferase involved in cell wall biosynthesis